MAPNGIIAHLFGPIEGRRHGAFMLGESNLLPLLERMVKPNGDPYVVYGDPAYGITRHIISPFRGAHLTRPQQLFNAEMSKCRICVEWGFGKNPSVFYVPRFSEKSQGPFIASCQVLFSWRPFN